MSRTIIVVPCYNEERRLDSSAFLQFVDSIDGIDFLFVNDGSRDETARVLRETCARNPARMRVMDLPKNSGKAEAVRQGVLAAFSSEPECIGYWDADLATPLDAIREFRDILGANPDIQMVFGARVRLLGRKIERRAVRHYAGRVFATAASETLNLPIYDTQCGAKLLRATPEIRSAFETPFISPWIFDVEIVARMIRGRRGTGLPPVENIIYEYPLHTWRDIRGSKVKPSDFLKAAFDILRIRRRYMRS